MANELKGENHEMYPELQITGSFRGAVYENQLFQYWQTCVIVNTPNGYFLDEDYPSKQNEWRETKIGEVFEEIHNSAIVVSSYKNMEIASDFSFVKMASLTKEVEDAHGDKYDMEFEIDQKSDDYPFLVCPLCGNSLQSNTKCAFGHIAYTIIDVSEIDVEMLDAIRDD